VLLYFRDVLCTCTLTSVREKCNTVKKKCNSLHLHFFSKRVQLHFSTFFMVTFLFAYRDLRVNTENNSSGPARHGLDMHSAKHGRCSPDSFCAGPHTLNCTKARHKHFSCLVRWSERLPKYGQVWNCVGKFKKAWHAAGFVPRTARLKLFHEKLTPCVLCVKKQNLVLK
jgi:hypothetical protein